MDKILSLNAFTMARVMLDLKMKIISISMYAHLYVCVCVCVCVCIYIYIKFFKAGLLRQKGMQYQAFLVLLQHKYCGPLVFHLRMKVFTGNRMNSSIEITK